MNQRHDEDGGRGIGAAWQAHRRRAYDVAYRMLGSFSEAEDIVQEAYARLVKAGIDTIDDVPAWLVTVTARLCLDHMRSARSQRTTYVGPWLPEPLMGGEPSLEDHVTLDESVSMALMVVLETLSPAERTAFVLHDIFQVPFDEIAVLVGRSPAACRQLASRARRRIADSRREERFGSSRAQLGRVAAEFATAFATGTFDSLLRVLDPGVVGTFDSGGRVAGAPVVPVEGRKHVARVIVRSFADTAARFDVADVNGAPGVIITVGNRILAVVSLTVFDGRVVHIDAVGNPDKLAHLR